MSSFFDRTASVARWCKATELAPGEAVEILRQRLSQAKAYWQVVGRRMKSSEHAANPQTFAARDGDLALALWDDFKEAAAVLQADPTLPFFELVEAVYRVVEALDLKPALLYNGWLAGVGNLWELLHKPFEILHEAGHRLSRVTEARFSDNPYVRGRGIPDSDAWLRERYPLALSGH